MIKVGDRVKIVSLHKRDAYFRDGIAGSRGVVQEVDGVRNRDGINYYTVSVLITESSETNEYKDCCDTPFYFAYAQLRKAKK